MVAPPREVHSVYIYIIYLYIYTLQQWFGSDLFPFNGCVYRLLVGVKYALWGVCGAGAIAGDELGKQGRHSRLPPRNPGEHFEEHGAVTLAAGSFVKRNLKGHSFYVLIMKRVVALLFAFFCYLTYHEVITFLLAFTSAG